MIRFFDIIFASIALLILFPLVLLVMLIMLFAQGFPLVFSQTRSGKDFVLFQIYKLRTMKLRSEDELGLTRGLSDDRITKLGFFLRKYKLDELPQLINILNGEMSIVGSRPQVPFYTEKFKNYYGKILELKPGLISPAAIKFSDEEEIFDQVADPVLYYEEVLIPIKCQMDIELVTNFGLKKYFSVIINYTKKILFQT